VPHGGTFAWLDPYNVKPRIHRILWRLGLYKHLHNGSCDIRKGHKHYLAEEIAKRFEPLQLEEVRYWGYVFDPLLSWTNALRLPAGWLDRLCSQEFKQSWGVRAFNIALLLRKPA
jgi:hypothetical protein